MQSALYEGVLRHRRFSPTTHDFSYKVFMAWLNLDDINALGPYGISNKRFAISSFYPKDYPLGSPLKQAALDKLFELTGEKTDGPVMLLCQLRYFGIHFNPVNFYYCYDRNEVLRWLLVEVNNTPWNEFHYYAVCADNPEATPKAFHVSPFNPMDMTYQWFFKPPAQTLSMHIENHQEDKVFDATLSLKKRSLTRKNLYSLTARLPLMTVKTALAIYWQAVKLWVKRTPIYNHPSK